VNDLADVVGSSVHAWRMRWLCGYNLARFWALSKYPVGVTQELISRAPMPIYKSFLARTTCSYTQLRVTSGKEAIYVFV
jgi:hypothetical protein